MAKYGWVSTHQSSGLLTVYIIRRFLMILRNKLRFARWAMMSDIPVRSGHTNARWILPGDIPVNTTDIYATNETGEASVANTATWTTYETKCRTYGNYQKTSDLLDASWLPQAKNMIANIFAYAGAKSVDTLMRNNADDTTEFLHAGNMGTSSEDSTMGGADANGLQTTDTASAQDLAVMAGKFDQADAEGFDAIRGDYALMLHGKACRQLQVHVEPGGATSGVKISWHDTQKHTPGGQQQLKRYEIGTYASMSVQKTNNIATEITGSHSGYVNIALASGAIGRANLDMRNVRVIVIPPGKPDKSDPLNLYGTIGWKWRGAHRPLDVNNRAIKYYTSVSN